MLNHPTLEKLQALRLPGMVRALQEQAETADIGVLSFEERLGLLVDRELTERENRRLKTRLGKARLRQGRLPGGHRLPASQRAGQGAAAIAGRLPVAARAPQRAHHGADGRGQDLHRLRPSSPGLP